MCKLAIIPNVKPGKQDLAWEFIENISRYLSERDKDGLGYFALGQHGIFGERWLKNEDAFDKRDENTLTDDLKIPSEYVKYFSETSNPGYNYFGKHDYKGTTCIALHTRMATCEKTMANVHPFVNSDNSIAVVHNGVITNHGLYSKRYSTCDSETILSLYERYEVPAKPSNIDTVVESMTGWYASAVLSKHGEEYFLDIFKDDRAQLTAVYIDQLETVVFVTNVQHAISVCEDIGLTIRMRSPMKSNFFMRHNARTGVVTVDAVIKPNVDIPVYNAYSQGMGDMEGWWKGTLESDDHKEWNKEVNSRFNKVVNNKVKVVRNKGNKVVKSTKGWR